MTVKLDPEPLELRAPPRPVTRLNRRMLVILTALLAGAILGVSLWSLQASAPRKVDEVTNLHNVEHVTRAEGLERLPSDYSKLVQAEPKVSIPQLGSPLPGELGGPVLRAEREAGLAPSLPSSSLATGNFRSDPLEDAARVARLNRQREAEEAVKAPLFFKANQHGAPMTPMTVSATPNEPSADMAGQTATQTSDATNAQNLQERKQAFVQASDTSATRSTALLLPPASPYQVMAGTLIPAALMTGINSDLPGQVIATVTEPVFDTATGLYLLIPQGSRLLGRYDSQVAYGQRRVLLVWTRLILPDASSITLDRLPGVDTAGFAGLEDGVDWHWDRILAGAALSTLLGVGAELAAPNRNNSGNDSANGSGNGVVVATRQGVQDSVNQVGQEMTKRNLSVQPTLTIRPGFAVRAIVNKDLVLKPYQPSQNLSYLQGANP